MKPSNLRSCGPLLLVFLLGLSSSFASILTNPSYHRRMLNQDDKVTETSNNMDQELEKNVQWLEHLLDIYKSNPSIVKQVNGMIEKFKQSFKPSNINKSDELLDGADHPCYRKCVEGETMTCRYKFVLEPYQSMSKACYDCPLNVADCARKDCIAADGMSRSLTVINRKLPGPKVEVCFGDTVIVDLTNGLLDESTSMHWHGHHMRKTPYMDGVPLITQCPISVASTFQYKFIAEHAGTHLWHSHSGMQRTDGDVGALIIRAADSFHKDLYDYDLSEHVMVLLDWVHERGTTIFTKNFHTGGRLNPASILVNGKGRFKQFSNGKAAHTPVARFHVKKGFRYRFRVVNGEFHVCPIEMSVVGHDITVISSDGHDIEPIEAASLVIYAGERFDFILNANQDIDNYWFMFRGLLNCDPRFNSVRQVALLHYDGAPFVEPEDTPNWEDSHREGLQVNALNKGTGQEETVAIPELVSVKPDDISLKEEADHKFFIAYDFNTKDNNGFHKYPHYGIHQVAPNLRTSTPQFNHITMKMQNFALLPGRDKIIPEKHFCNESTVQNCDKEFCACTHVINIPLNSVVEIIMVDEGKASDSNHPMHLHGYDFRVVGMERLGLSTTVEDVKKLDAEGKLHRNLKGAPLKDTVTVPDGGYTIIRFLADNPGYWIYHCHLELHAEVGMALVFKVGEHEDFPPVPEGFPTCGDYVPE